MFYLSHVIAIETASVVDDYNHIIRKGTKYLKCKYLEKKIRKKGSIFHKLLQKVVYVLPAQVVYPFVSDADIERDDLSISASEYQWLTDSI